MSTPVPSYLGIATRLRDLNSVFEASEWQLLCDLRVACPGTIVSFDPVTQLAQVQPTVRENIIDPGTLIPTPTTLPLLDKVPIVFFRAGNCSLTLPVQAGDECLMIFGDSDRGAWLASGGMQNQEVPFRHDLSFGFAIVGIWNQTRKLVNYSSATAQLRSDDGQTIIELNPASGLVNIQAQQVNVTGAQQVNVHSSAKVDINGSGHTTIEGKDFLLHKHTGVQTGGGISGPVL
jgi:hypothetical protein